MQAIVRTAVAEAVGAVLAETQRLVQQLERRVEELERRPVAVASPAHGFEGHAAPAAGAPWATSAHAPQTNPPRPLLDVANIERTVHVDVDPALDGGRRRRRLSVFVVLFFLVVFAGLFSLLAQSYLPSH